MKVVRNAIAGAILAGVSLAKPTPNLIPTVDLGYSVYEGTFDARNNINAFKGYDISILRAIGMRS